MNPNCTDYDEETGACKRKDPCSWWDEEKYAKKNRGCIR